MDRLHPGATFHLVVTGNVVLRNITTNTFKVFFGQSFGRAKTNFFGQRKGGEDDRLFKEYSVGSVQDAGRVPVSFTREDFGQIFNQNYESSSVVIHSMVNYVYIFGLGLKNYEKQVTTGRKLTKLW